MTARTAATTIIGVNGASLEKGVPCRGARRLQHAANAAPNSSISSHHTMIADNPFMPTANPMGAIALTSSAPIPPGRISASKAITPRLSNVNNTDCSTAKNELLKAAAMILATSYAREAISTHRQGTRRCRAPLTPIASPHSKLGK